MRLALRLLAAVFLFGLGLHLAGVTRFFGRIEIMGQPLWSRIAPLARRLLPVRSPLHAALLGAAWGFVPCGLSVLLSGEAADPTERRVICRAAVPMSS